MIKLLLIFALFSCSSAWSATYNAVLTGVTKNGAQYSIKSPTATVNAGSVTTTATVGSTATVSGGGISIAGQTISMPATATLAAGAAQVALTAVRANPAGLMIGLTAQWLISKGLSYANDEWTQTTSGYEYNMYGGGWASSQAAACAGSFTYAKTVVPGPYANETTYTTGGTYGYGFCRMEYGWPSQYFSHHMQRRTSSGSHVATEADFTVAAADPIPDGAADELLDTVPLPINTPSIQSTPVEIVGTPYLDPVSGRWKQDRTIATPSPTAENPFAVGVRTYSEDAGNIPQQTTAPPAPTTEASISDQPLNIQFPNDYARQGEAQAAADSINTTLGAKIDKITETGADPADPLQPQGSEFDQAFFQGTFSNLLGWQLPAHTSQCPTGSFDWNATTYTINAHCQLITDHFSALSSVMSVVWTILALFILLGA